MLNKIKDKTDSLIVAKVKRALIKASKEKGLELEALLTPAIEEKFDALAREILKEHGYKKLVALGLKKII